MGMNGVNQWIFQRSANLVTIVFILVLAVIVVQGVTYESLSTLMAQTWFKVYLAVTLVIGSANSVLAGWQVVGDYAGKIGVPIWLLTGLCMLVTLIYFVLALTLIF